MHGNMLIIDHHDNRVMNLNQTPLAQYITDSCWIHGSVIALRSLIADRSKLIQVAWWQNWQHSY